MLSKEPLYVVDERDCGLFDTRSQSVLVVEIKICDQVAFKNRVDTFRRCDNTVFGPLVVFEQLPVLPLNLPIASRKPGFKSKCVVVEDNRNLQVVMLEEDGKSAKYVMSMYR